jgi:hypothetical protein
MNDAFEKEFEYKKVDYHPDGYSVLHTRNDDLPASDINIKDFISQHYLLKSEVKKIIEGKMRVIDIRDSEEYAGHKETYNEALSDLLTLLKIGD